MSAHFLANGRSSVLFTDCGGGGSKWNDYALTAWTADRSEDNGGLVVYLRDLDSDAFFSVGQVPVFSTPGHYEVRRECGRVILERDELGVEVRLDVCVAPHADVEIRRLVLRNTSERRRRIEVTSYVEIVLLPPAAHAAHPGFAKLFVETERQGELLLARRRPRSASEHHPWLLHALHGGGGCESETDRVRFLGRGRGPARPAALSARAPLSGTVGSVLDPVFSLRRVAELAPGESTELVLLLACGAERDALVAVASDLATATSVQAAFAGADDLERERLRAAGATAEAGARWQQLAAAMLCADPRLRASEDVLRRAKGSALSLQAHGLAGEGLLTVAEVENEPDLDAARELLRAASYWRALSLKVRVAFLCADALLAAAREQAGESAVVLARSAVPDADLVLACASGVGRAVPDPSRAGSTPPGIAWGGTDWPGAPERRRSPAAAGVSGRVGPASSTRPISSGAEAGRGEPRTVRPAVFAHGFSDDGSEYVLRVDPGADELPPMPWINVISNELFGLLVSETGAGYTWSQNSRENRLTPWFNDPVRDPHGEALYVRDEESGAFWSPLPGPCPAPGGYEVHHGFGYSRFSHTSHGLEQEVTLFVPAHAPVKIARLRLTNSSARPRALSLFSFHQLVLGVLPEDSSRFVVTAAEPSGPEGAAGPILLARNTLNNEFATAVVFAAAATPAGAASRLSGDRTSFLGRNGSASAPAAVVAGDLDGRTGAGIDTCAALQVTQTIAPGATLECSFLLGEGCDEEQVRVLVERYRQPAAVEQALAEVREFWRSTVSAVQVRTPSPALDRMVNGWLLYQVLSCRVWGRSAFYQSGGAFGFRDQLQDSAALIWAQPERTRAQIVLHAEHQFVEGDVLHWWHPPTSRGLRTRFVDDLNWLPYLTAFYVRSTGDWSVLDEPARFVTARALEPGEDEAYVLPLDSGEVGDVYEHCCRALDRSLTRGEHGLPLFGTGDWNDGMNRVGREGRGESVWMAFFLHRVIADFVPLCERRGDSERVSRYRAYQQHLEVALDTSAWDGDWYRRGYYDDGTPLGSVQNVECRIDALAQAWSALSDAVPRERATRAMVSAEKLLVDREAGLIRLLTPPFDRDPHDPGYIKGYVPGIRENGGQYTHAAVWVLDAMAELGWRDRAAAYLEMISPVSHTSTTEKVAVYQVEPYVVVADVYGVAPHVGRGGWSWYTGSAAWMYRVALGSILGLRLDGGDTLWVKPCIPDDWPGFGATLRLSGGRSLYEIEVCNPDGCSAAVQSAEIDGAAAAIVGGAARIALATDGTPHRVVVTLGGCP